MYLTILVRKKIFRWALTILIFVHHNLNPVSPKIDLSKRCAAEPTILVILVKRNHWPSPHFLDSGTPRDNCSNWRHRFSCGQLHVCGSNYTSVWTQSPNTLSSISVPTLFLSFLFVACACVYICTCDIKKEPENCVGDIWSVARVDNAVLPSFLLSHSPLAMIMVKQFHLFFYPSIQDKWNILYSLIELEIRKYRDLKVIATAVPSLKKSVKTSSSGEKEFKILFSSQSWFLNV